MARLHPFRPQRPRPDAVQEVASVPYDVICTEQARSLAADSPRSFLHVVRPEVDLPPDTGEDQEAVYEKGAENLRAFIEAEYTVRDETPGLYVYRLEDNDGHVQTGLFGCVSVEDYDEGTIVRHERTRPAKVRDRRRHILAQRAHPEPIMLTYRDREAVQAYMHAVQERAPVYDFTTRDGVRHVLWRGPDPSPVVDAFATIDHLYIADGHHRCKASSQAAATLRDASEPTEATAEYEFFPAILFPMSAMRIMAYHRLVRTLPVAPAEFVRRLESRLNVERNVTTPTPPVKGMVSFFLDGVWHRATLPPTAGTSVSEALDVARLSEHVLEPLLDITDARRDPNLSFVGGPDGVGELERRVESGEAQLGIALYPTRIEELVAVADAGELMPPKSTWFAPKPASGLLVHLF